MHPFPIRQIACRIYTLVHSLRKTEALVAVSRSSISRWLKCIDRAAYTPRSLMTKTQMVSQLVRDTVQCNPLTPVSDIQKKIQTSLNVSVSPQLIRSVLRSLGYSRKKARFCGRPATQDARKNEFIVQRDCFRRDQRQFVAIDETAFGRYSHSHVMGYAPKGQPLYVSKKRPRVTTTSVVACVSEKGLIGMQSLQNQAFNTDSFLYFLRSLNLPSRTVIILDNVRFHHSKLVKEYASQAGIDLLYVPPYCPWFNPIEFCFSVVKRAYIRCEDVQLSFGALGPKHCHAFFDKCMNTNTGPIIRYIQ
jgi:transposase